MMTTGFDTALSPTLYVGIHLNFIQWRDLSNKQMYIQRLHGSELKH